MDDLLEGGIVARLGQECSATVAMHTHEGMIREGHIVDILISPGTVSHAFGGAETLIETEGGVAYRYLSRGFVQMVEVDSLPIDACSVKTLRYNRRRIVDTGDRFATDSEIVAERREQPGPLADPPPPRSDAEVMTAIAREVAATAPAVAVPRPQVPQLGAEPVENLRRLFNLTYPDLARLFGISERHAHRWQRDGIPEERRAAVDALQAIGLTVIGGLGPAGARAWLRTGSPSGEQLVKAGKLAQLAARADAEKDSPFT
jgi:DNA-binding transcriptional regulator YiaG